MTGGRTRVLEIAAEGAGFELDADLDADGRAEAFYAWTGGPHGFEEAFGEESEPRVSHGPMSWESVRQEWLRPHDWLERYPVLVHAAVAELVDTELVHASAAARIRWRAKLQAAAFRADILRAYARQNRIHPFIGDTFASGDAGALRVMTIGINAYLSEDDWPRQNPDWFAGWFKEARHKFDRTVAEDAGLIAEAIAGKTPYFANLAYGGKGNIFHTNAVKAYLPEAGGKRSDQVTRQVYELHVPTWHAELDIMAKHGVLPHVVIVFGRPFWEWAWQAFHPRTTPKFAHLKVHGFANSPGDGHHFANRVEVEGVAGRHHLALLAVRHPAARATSKAVPEWVLSHPDVRDLFCLAAGAPG